jgi:hypothetical protein
MSVSASKRRFQEKRKSDNLIKSVVPVLHENRTASGDKRRKNSLLNHNAKFQRRVHRNPETLAENRAFDILVQAKLFPQDSAERKALLLARKESKKIP